MLQVRKYFGLVDRFVRIYEEGRTGNEVFENMKLERKHHRRAVTLARQLEGGGRKEYPRDRTWRWKRREEVEISESSSSNDSSLTTSSESAEE